MKSVKYLIQYLVTITILIVGSYSFAQNANAPQSDSKPKRERKAVLNFEDELIEGSTQKPDLFYLLQKKNYNYNRLIKLRENFLPEMRKTSEDLQRSRGGN